MKREEFDRWSGFHYSTIRGKDIPMPDSREGKIYYTNIYHAFVKRAVTDSEAREATRRVSANGHTFASQQLAKLLDAVDAIRRDRRVSGDAEALTIEEAYRLGRLCPDCQGNGFLTALTFDVRRVAIFCACVLGRAIRLRIQNSAPDVIDRIPDAIEIKDHATTF